MTIDWWTLGSRPSTSSSWSGCSGGSSVRPVAAMIDARRADSAATAGRRRRRARPSHGRAAEIERTRAGSPRNARPILAARMPQRAARAAARLRAGAKEAAQLRSEAAKQAIDANEQRREGDGSSRRATSRSRSRRACSRACRSRRVTSCLPRLALEEIWPRDPARHALRRRRTARSVSATPLDPATSRRLPRRSLGAASAPIADRFQHRSCTHRRPRTARPPSS